ncbi:hypothetical protein AB0D08_07235 [Kitasatospora sp. NPDC048540]|uniref:hypothetical protein n=1 Tax=Kitasatospora sp. NPDC048540 TaxID=3155634 RepID=UPI0033C8EDC7
MTASMSFSADGESRVSCHDYREERTPILAIWGGGVHLTLSARETTSLPDHLAFARSLVRETAAYLAALEHFAATQVKAD